MRLGDGAKAMIGARVLLALATCAATMHFGAIEVAAEATIAIEGSDAPSKTSEMTAARGLILLLPVVVLLLVVWLVASHMITRARQHREQNDRTRTAPTNSEDVWAMHKLPDDEDSPS